MTKSGYPELRGKNAFWAPCEMCDGTGLDEYEIGINDWPCPECNGTRLEYWDDEKQAMWEDQLWDEELAELGIARHIATSDGRPR